MDTELVINIGSSVKVINEPKKYKAILRNAIRPGYYRYSFAYNIKGADRIQVRSIGKM